MFHDVLVLGSGGTVLRVSVERVSVERQARQPTWFSARIGVQAHPWQGTLETTFTGDDLRDWASGLGGTTLPRTVVLGGDRAAELTLLVQEQIGGTPGHLSVRADIVPSGDDPYPLLRFLVFDVASDFGALAASAIATALASGTQG